MKLGIFNILTAFLILAVTGNAFAQSAEFVPLKIPSQIEKAKSGGEPVPWPFGTEVPFPWDDIDGVWKVLSGSKEVYFAFKVLEDNGLGERQVNIRQISPRTCTVTATGVGYESDRIVRGVMNGRGLTYRISVRAFLDDKKSQETQSPVQVTVLSISSIENEGKTFYLKMSKVSSGPTFQCGRSNNKGTQGTDKY